MADIKQKPKMDKPKQKSTDSALPKDARRMLAKEYRQAAGERANDVRSRPEQEAVGVVEDSIRSARDHGLAAAKRGGKKLASPQVSKKRSGTDTAENPMGNMPGESANTTASEGHPKGKEKMGRDARRNVAKEKKLRGKAEKSVARYNGGSSLNGSNSVKNSPAFETGADNSRCSSVKTKSAAMQQGKQKQGKQGFRHKTRHNASSNAKKSAKAVQKSERRAQAVASTSKKAAAKAAEFTKKMAAMVAKAAAAVGKALIAFAGPVGIILLIFIVVAAIAAVIASPFGLFFSGEDEDGKAAMQQTVAAISYDYHQNIQDIILSNSHDEMRFQYINNGYSRTDNWIDILAVYAVRTADFDDGMDVVELDEARIEKLRAVFWDMQDISYELKNEQQYDIETETYTDHYVLYIRAECISAWTMADRYGFNSDQREILAEMLSGEYDGYFVEMIGSAGLFSSIGDGSGVVGSGNFIWPSAASNYVTSPHGTRIHPITGKEETHLGIDIGAGAGTSVLASDAGTVISTSVHSSYGTHLLIDHGNGYQTLYAHMSAAHVSVGDTVEQGQVIGLVGSTGVSTNPHLHFEVRVNGNCIDPLQFFDNYTTAR